MHNLSEKIAVVVKKHPTAISFIETYNGILDIDEIVEQVLESIVNKVKQRRDEQTFNALEVERKAKAKTEQPVTLHSAVQSALRCSYFETWGDFVNDIISIHPHLETQLAAVERDNKNIARYNNYYWRDLYMRNQSNGKVGVDSQGKIEYYN